MDLLQSIKNLKNFLPLLRQQKDILYTSLLFDQKADTLTQLALNSNSKGVTNDKYGNTEIIVSLTTYGRRLYRVHLTIESLMQQSMKANRIVLWLSDEFKDTLPQTLLKQTKRGLDIRYCKDIRSYTKLVPSLREFPEATIITVDDDIIYEYDVLENLIVPHLKDQKSIFANRIHLMKKDAKGKLESYMKWKWSAPYTGRTDKCNFLTGVGGVLYPPNSLDKEVLNEKVFLDICKYADDIWFTAMALKAGTPIIKTFTFNSKGEGYLENIHVQETGLSIQNIDPISCRNDYQIESVFSKYDLYKLIQ